MIKVSVIIVSYNAKHFLDQCLQSVEAALVDIPSEIIVVDNNSPEKTVEFVAPKFPNVQFVAMQENLGFAKANNLGVKMAKGQYVLILNPDMIVGENLFHQILPFADARPDLGALGVRLVDANGKFHPESKRNIPGLANTFGKLFGSFLSKLQTKGYYKTEVDEFENAPAEILVGAFMLMDRTKYLEVGGFDEQYFMYGEDIDLSFSLLNAGYTNYYFGETTAIHYKGESTRKDKKYLRNFFGAMDIFVDKYFKKNVLKYLIFKFGLKARYLLAQMIWMVSNPDEKKKENLDLTQLQRIRSSDEINEKTVQILLDGHIFSNQQMIDIISKYHQENRQFYIQPKGRNLVIGDKGVFENY